LGPNLAIKLTHLISFYKHFLQMEVFWILMSFQKKVFFSVNGVNVFQGCHIGVITHIQSQFLPFMFSVHYMAHWTNLVVQTFLTLPMINHSQGNM